MKTVRGVFLTTLLIKAFLALLVPVLPDEAYYWTWGFHLELSYFDHPPMVAVLGYFGEFSRSLFAFLGPGALRWPALLLGHGALFFWLQYFDLIDTEHASASNKTLWLWVMLLHPFFGMGSFILNPDVPLMFFWAAGFLCFARALKHGRVSDYALLGAVLGLAFLSKYHIVIVIPILLTAVLIDPKLPRPRWSLVPVTLVAGLLFCSPVFIWNAHHDWISFRFQTEHGLGGDAWDPMWTSTYIVGQCLLFFPLFVPSLIRAVSARPRALLTLQTLFPWAFFLLTSFKNVVEANWPIAAFPTAYWQALSQPAFRRGFAAFTIFWIAISGLVLGWLRFGGAGLPNRLAEIRDLGALAALSSQYSPLYGGSYQIASALWLHQQRPVYKLRGMNRFDSYDMLDESEPKKFPIYVARTEDQSLPAWVEYGQYAITVIEKRDNLEVLVIEK